MAAVQLRLFAEEFSLENRKYIGSKARLLNFIETRVTEVVGQFSTLIDLFAGTGVVGYYFAVQGKTVTANDNLYSNFVALSTFLCHDPSTCNPERLQELIDELNALTPAPGYCAGNFGGTYFTHHNAAKIDAVREAIQILRADQVITEHEFEALLASLLYASDKVANTCGQYDAFLKHLGKESYSEDGTHLVDASAYKPLTLLMPAIRPLSKQNRAVCQDANETISSLQGDVLYLDPPYNSRQYIDNYHVLENIVTWNRPVLHGKTKKFARDHLKSAYSAARTAAVSLDDLLARAKVEHAFLSYNSEGFLDQDTLLAILRRHGKVDIFEEDYNVFGNGAGKSQKRQLKERLYYCRK